MKATWLDVASDEPTSCRLTGIDAAPVSLAELTERIRWRRVRIHRQAGSAEAFG